MDIKTQINTIIDTALQQQREQPQLRFGQALFNSAYDLFPDECNQLRSSQYDCFYQNEHCAMFLNQLEYLLTNKK